MILSGKKSELENQSGTSILPRFVGADLQGKILSSSSRGHKDKKSKEQRGFKVYRRAGQTRKGYLSWK